jgi:hypothetical protein
MSLLRLLNGQGIAGIAISFALVALLVVQKAETRHWKRQSSRFEQLYRSEQSAFATTVANYRAAAEAARAHDLANAQRVAAEQHAINQRSTDELEARLADARARADRLRRETAAAPGDPGGRTGSPMSGLPASASGADQAASKDRLPQSDQLIATEQAIELDELIKWAIRQHAIDPNRPANSLHLPVAPQTQVHASERFFVPELRKAEEGQ